MKTCEMSKWVKKFLKKFNLRKGYLWKVGKFLWKVEELLWKVEEHLWKVVLEIGGELFSNARKQHMYF